MISSFPRPTFRLRAGSIVYSSPRVIEGNTTFKDFDPKPCRKCKMVCDIFELDDDGVCELCKKIIVEMET